MRLTELKQEQLDEGVMQSVFNFLWTATGKVLDKLPVIGDKREEARVLKDYEGFVRRMDDAGTKKFIGDLTKKIKSTHSATAKATERHVSFLSKQITKVKSSTDARQYISRMNDMHRTLKELKSFIEKSNKGVSDRKAQAKG